jgi:hypothetical protein
MKWLKTMVLFSQGGVVNSTAWSKAHESYVRAIRKIDHPRGSGALTIRAISKDKQLRNGVTFLKHQFVEHMKHEAWLTEVPIAITSAHSPPQLLSYPDMASHFEPIGGKFGGFDFMSMTPDGTRLAIEWETGNISSSHRSLNKLVIALSNGDIQAGVLIVPSRDLYGHLTDRVGNLSELSPYLTFWKRTGALVDKGLLAISVVEHDALSNDPTLPYLKLGTDGRAKQGKERRAQTANKSA